MSLHQNLWPGEGLCVPLQPCLPASPTTHRALQAGDAAAAAQDLLLQLHLQVLTQAVPALGFSPERGFPSRLHCSCWACTVCCCLSLPMGSLPSVVTLVCSSSRLPHCLPLLVVCSHALPPNALNQSGSSFLSSSGSSPERISPGQ